jgi:hypothetical protein
VNVIGARDVIRGVRYHAITAGGHDSVSDYLRDIPYELTRCPVCGSADSRQVAGPDDIRAEVEELWEFHGRRLRRGTPPEALTDRVAFSQHAPYRLVRCRTCTLVYRNPRERTSAIKATYAEDDTADDEIYQTLLETQRAAYQAQANRLADFLTRVPRGVEVGSYVGGFLAVAKERGWDFEGIDVNRKAAAFARRAGYRVRVGTLESLDPMPHDVVAIWNTFEQLPEARISALYANRWLRKGGVLALRIPNGGFYARLRKVRGRWRPAARAALVHNNLLSFPYRVGYTRKAITRLLNDTGFEILKIHGDTLVPIADRWTRAWAAVEERLVKGALRLSGSFPWMEVYARKV